MTFITFENIKTGQYIQRYINNLSFLCVSDISCYTVHTSIACKVTLCFVVDDKDRGKL